MKKLLGIAVLGLLLSGNAYAELLKYNCTNVSGGGITYIKYNKLVDIEKKKIKLEIEGNSLGRNFTFNGEYEIEIIDDETIKFFSNIIFNLSV